MAQEWIASLLSRLHWLGHLPAEVRQLRLQLAMRDEGIEHLRGLVQSLAARVARQSEVLSRHTERQRDSA
jgi:hypothetical protein